MSRGQRKDFMAPRGALPPLTGAPAASGDSVALQKQIRIAEEEAEQARRKAETLQKELQRDQKKAAKQVAELRKQLSELQQQALDAQKEADRLRSIEPTAQGTRGKPYERKRDGAQTMRTTIHASAAQLDAVDYYFKNAPERFQTRSAFIAAAIDEYLLRHRLPGVHQASLYLDSLEEGEGGPGQRSEPVIAEAAE